MGELIIVDFRAGKVIARSNYWRSASAMHREALQGFTVRKAKV